jgi:hypothetical protein
MVWFEKDHDPGPVVEKSGAHDALFKDCDWFLLCHKKDVDTPAPKPVAHHDKGYIDCGWGRLLEENTKNKHINVHGKIGGNIE